MSSSAYDYSLYSILPPSHKKRSIIVHLCSNKIAWDNYASLQMISEYFSVCGRPLNHVKKPSSFVEFDKPAAILELIPARSWEPVLLNP